MGEGGVGQRVRIPGNEKGLVEANWMLAHGVLAACCPTQCSPFACIRNLICLEMFIMEIAF